MTLLLNRVSNMEDRCVICGAIIPEGRMVCPICEKLAQGDSVDTKSGGDEA